MPGSENLIAIMFFYVYLLQSAKDNLYLGYTTDLKKRLQKHNRGLVFATKSCTSWQLIFYEAYRSKKDAIRREKYLKTNQGSQLLKRMLKEYFYSSKNNQISTTWHA